MTIRPSLSAILLMALAGSASSASRPTQSTTSPEISILTYNVHGLPWPLAGRRGAALEAMAAHLRALRANGMQPHVVAFQEAFTDEAKEIGAAAGYRYVRFGPGPETASPPVQSSSDRNFLGAASYFSGEREGHRVDSGLAIFSDYPIVAARQIVYPICAGYDCLASKGALAVRLAVPGVAAPVVVVDTHLNSARASGVAANRAFYAYRRQLDILDRFIGTVVPPGAALFLAGDFNVGRNPMRRGYFGYRMHSRPLGLYSAMNSCGQEGAGCESDNPSGLAESMRHSKDWLLYRITATLPVAPIRIAAPFGRTADGSMLSDHVGISAAYWIGRERPRLALGQSLAKGIRQTF